jgi:hypothetical protein
MKSWHGLSLGLMMSLSACAGPTASPDIPPCPVSGPLVAQDFDSNLPRTATHAWNWLGRMVLYCEAVNALRAR